MSKAEKPKAMSDALRVALETFQSGDYPRARELFKKLAEDPSASEGDRADAARLVLASRPDRAALLTGLACLGLFVLVVLVASVFQP